MSRRHASAVSEHPRADGTTTLATLQRGGSARIIGISDDGDPATARRLHALGFTPEASVAVVRRAPLADPVIFRVAGYEVALRRA